MDPRYGELQERYIGEMRRILPDLFAWWDGRSSGRFDEPNDFDRRWPAGLVAHPRVLDVFRRYFLLVERINIENERPPEDPRSALDEASWGQDPPADRRNYTRPIDLLVNDLEDEAEDVWEVVQGIVFIPVGVDPEGELS
jgi:hypothetical protein